MKQKKVLVTGAGGYIGRHVVESLLNMGMVVIAADIVDNGIDSRAIIVKKNILEYDEDIYEKLNRPDICIHMAWRDGFVHNSKVHMQDLSDHYNFLSNIKNGGLKHMAIMGTMHEVGYWEGAINEDTPTNPTSLYGISKEALRKSSEMLFEDDRDIYQWLRAFYIYGDDKYNNSIFAKIIQASEEGKKKFPFTTGKNKYDFVEVRELADMIAMSAVQTKITGIINCATGRPVSLAEKVEAFITDNKLSIKLEYGAFPDRPYDSPGVWGDSEKIEKIKDLHGKE